MNDNVSDDRVQGDQQSLAEIDIAFVNRSELQCGLGDLRCLRKN